MLGAAFALIYLVCGVFMVRCLLPSHRPLNRLWLGLSLGVIAMMWLPALMAFFVKFTILGHGISLIVLLLLTAICWFVRDKRSTRPWDQQEISYLKIMLAVMIPLILLGGYLQYTHNLRIDEFGNYNVGQSTYGDLSLHTAIITSMKNAAFPMDYSILPGSRLSYPFLTDGFSASFYLMGWSLQAALNIPGTFMMALCYMGVLVMGREMTSGKKAAVLAFLLVFLNGGLGFLYTFDLSAQDWTERVSNVLNGYYQTPTNQPTPNNLRWSNIICDMFVPQRTFLGGWCAGLPCFYLLYTLMQQKKEALLMPGAIGAPSKQYTLQGVCLLGIWAGCLPMIHTHTFLALALCSVGFLAYDMLHSQREHRFQTFKPYLIYGVLAALLSIPQLFLWTFGQAGGSDNFLTFQFNWVNNPGGNGMIDFYLWFYIKNIGIPVILIICALVEKNPRHRKLAAGAFAIFIVAEFIRFQPNEYDNNKLFYLWYLLCAMLAADYAGEIWRRLKGLRGRYVLAVFGAVALFLSAGLSIWREVRSDYQAYTSQEVAVAAFVKEETPEHAMFLTGTQHLNPVSSLAGRTIVCGPDLWLHWHGFDTTERKADIRRFYEAPLANMDVLTKYDIAYIYISSHELNEYDINLSEIVSSFPLAYEDGVIAIYQVVSLGGRSV